MINRNATRGSQKLFDDPEVFVVDVFLVVIFLVVVFVAVVFDVFVFVVGVRCISGWHT